MQIRESGPSDGASRRSERTRWSAAEGEVLSLRGVSAALLPCLQGRLPAERPREPWVPQAPEGDRPAEKNTRPLPPRAGREWSPPVARLRFLA